MDQFLREAMFYGPDAVDTLSKTHVMVLGIGGVGSYCAEALGRAGVGKITLVDNDTVGLTNLNRQLCALHSTLGQFKSDVMAARLRDINPDAEIISLPKLYCEENKKEFFSMQPDYIIDAIDLVSCKLSLIETAKSRNIPIISAMGTGNKQDPTRFQICDISATSGCPLARVMRKELRNRGIRQHMVLFSDEPPISPLPLETPPPGRRSIPASLSWVPSCAGLMLAGYVVRDIIGAKT